MHAQCIGYYGNTAARTLTGNGVRSLALSVFICLLLDGHLSLLTPRHTRHINKYNYNLDFFCKRVPITEIKLKQELLSATPCLRFTMKWFYRRVCIRTHHDSSSGNSFLQLISDHISLCHAEMLVRCWMPSFGRWRQMIVNVKVSHGPVMCLWRPWHIYGWVCGLFYPTRSWML